MIEMLAFFTDFCLGNRDEFRLALAHLRAGVLRRNL